jgi:hypothetical protein
MRFLLLKGDFSTPDWHYKYFFEYFKKYFVNSKKCCNFAAHFEKWQGSGKIKG